MSTEAHVRIDEGIKRGPRTKVKRSLIENAAREQARNTRGMYLTKYTAEQRQAAVNDALNSLQRGETVLDVATRRGIPRSTVESWLIADNSGSEASSLFYALQIAEAIDAMRTAQDPLAHARARDIRRAWAETAAVRNRNYMIKQGIEIEHVGDLGDRLRRARERVIEGEVVATQQPVNTPTNQGQDSADS